MGQYKFKKLWAPSPGKEFVGGNGLEIRSRFGSNYRANLRDFGGVRAFAPYDKFRSPF